MRNRVRKTILPAIWTVGIIVTFAWAAPRAHGRLGIYVQPDRNSYVLYEKIRLTLTIANYTGNKIDFGDSPVTANHLTFGVSRDEGRSFERIPRRDLIRGLELKPGEKRQLEVVINNMYNFQRGGEFLINVQVGHRRLRTDYRSESITIRIRDGIKLWTREIGVPVDNEDGPIPIRKIKLMQVQEGETELYCLRIEDDENVYAVLRLGEVIRGAEPQCKVDAVSNIHILLRLKSRLYIHRVYDYRGSQLQTSYYMMSQTKPELYRDSDDGTISVIGGRPAILGEDYVLDPKGASPAGELPGALRRRPVDPERLKQKLP